MYDKMLLVSPIASCSFIDDLSLMLQAKTQEKVMRGEGKLNIAMNLNVK